MTNKESLLPSDASNHLIHRSTDEQSLVDSNGFSDIPKKLLDFAKKSQVFDWMVGVRRKIHENSELGYEEFDTSKLIRAKLDKMGVKYKHPVAVTGSWVWSFVMMMMNR
ncbi:hypothetical protein QYF36_025617 [Acer negundo]|nr:hypothetical protein QYF36_025617 [Acer negundo]